MSDDGQEVKIHIAADTTDAEAQVAALEAKLQSLEQQRRRVFTAGTFLPRMFAEQDGTPSASRVISAAGSIVWFAILFLRFWRTGQMPTPGELLAGGIGANSAYLANQLKRILEPLGPKGGGSK